MTDLTEAMEHVRALTKELKPYHAGRRVRDCAACDALAAAQAWLSRVEQSGPQPVIAPFEDEGLLVTDDALSAEIARLTAELKASSELTSLVAQSIADACDMVNADPYLSKHFTETTAKFKEIVEFAREHAAKPSGALGGLDARWEVINKADVATVAAETIERCARACEALRAPAPEVSFPAAQFACARAVRSLAKTQGERT